MLHQPPRCCSKTASRCCLLKFQFSLGMCTSDSASPRALINSNLLECLTGCMCQLAANWIPQIIHVDGRGGDPRILMQQLLWFFQICRDVTDPFFWTPPRRIPTWRSIPVPTCQCEAMKWSTRPRRSSRKRAPTRSPVPTLWRSLLVILSSWYYATVLVDRSQDLISGLQLINIVYIPHFERCI